MSNPCLVVCLHRLEAEEYRSLPRQDLLLQRSHALIPKYFSKEATRPIGISDDIRERILQHFEQDLAPPGLFLEAQTQVRFFRCLVLKMGATRAVGNGACSDHYSHRATDERNQADGKYESDVRTFTLMQLGHVLEYSAPSVLVFSHFRVFAFSVIFAFSRCRVRVRFPQVYIWMQNELLPRFTKTPEFEPVAMFLAVNELDFLGAGSAGGGSESLSGRSRSGGSMMDRESSLRETANVGGASVHFRICMEEIHVPSSVLIVCKVYMVYVHGIWHPPLASHRSLGLILNKLVRRVCVGHHSHCDVSLKEG